MKKFWTYFGGVGAVLYFVGVLVFAPVICFGLSWFGGWILKICVGELISDGLNLLFDTTRFTPDFIPLACATLATIGRYFRSSQTNNNKQSGSY